MKSKNPLVVTTYTNPSGEIGFRVSGYLCGQRIRKNFSTRAEAESERQVLGVKVLQGDTNLRTAGTRLTDEQVRDAEADRYETRPNAYCR